MRPRLVDWTLFALTAFIAGSGFASWLLLDPEAAPIIVIHAAAGVAILVPLFWKLRRVEPRVTHARAWDWKTPLSIGTALAALGAVITGFVWVHAQWPTGYPNGMHLHIVFGLALCLLIALHMLARLKLPAKRDLQGRRDLLRWLGMAGLGAVALPAQDVINNSLNLPGAQRRFTGSRNAGDFTGSAMSITNWMFDHPAPVDPTTWRLRFTGAVDQPLTLRLDDLSSLLQAQGKPDDLTEITATLDCTGGWHSTQRWRGVRVSDLLERAGVAPDAQHISFISITGYRWSLPIGEARDALLATHYGEEPLQHWHGAPLRLVAPGRRGFMWVKWVTEVRVLREADSGQWIVIFTSGLDD
jgi:DMSO/TMAO reductase YedYZ molybdopterin-dependent catalytic subunit